VIHTPGHTSGHCSLWFESAGALIVGDELCTLDPLTGARGPQLMRRPFNLSSAKCLDSLTRLDGLETEVVPCGHGEPWREGIATAIERVRMTGRPSFFARLIPSHSFAAGEFDHLCDFAA
jgi:glyoxylase-like metal-dependent hydrolase (beta-lactamase superfamily II)